MRFDTLRPCRKSGDFTPAALWAAVFAFKGDDALEDGLHRLTPKGQEVVVTCAAAIMEDDPSMKPLAAARLAWERTAQPRSLDRGQDLHDLNDRFEDTLNWDDAVAFLAEWEGPDE